MQSNQKKVVKVTFKGDMKRLKMTSDYTSLVEQTHKAFGEGVIPSEFKFFYMDEDNELISINSQYDLEEALSNEDLGYPLKLIASTTVQEAREQLCQDISDTISMRESLNQSGFFNAPVQEMARLDLNQIQSQTSILATERAPIMRSAFQDDFEEIEHSDIQSKAETLVAQAVEPEEEFICTRPAEVLEVAPVEVEQKQELPIVEEIQMDKIVQDKKRDSKCERKSCMFGKHSKQLHGWCCASCKNEGCHGPACEKLKWENKNKQAVESDKSESDGEPTEEVATQVRDDVRDFCREAFSGMLSNFLQNKRAKQALVEHEGFECDGCAVNPIKGVRFKCSVCPDYDLCEGCEAKGIHSEHPMLKIRDPSMAPVKLICQYKDIAPHADAPQVPVEQPKQKPQPYCGKKSFIKYSGRFVKESFGDKQIVNPGEKIKKSWTFRNDGETNWPEDTLFIQTNGDNMNSIPVPLTAVINKDSEYTWEVELTAPEKEGRYQCYFRMVTGNNYRFGHKVWADILVQAPQIVDHKEEVVAIEEPVQVKEPEVMVCDFIAEAVADLKISEDIKPVDYPVIEVEATDKAGAEESPLNVSMKASGLMTPKEIYNNKIGESEIPEATKQSLIDLFELGFVNFEVNKALLSKYDNDTQKVANLLCEGALSESCIAQVFEH